MPKAAKHPRLAAAARWGLSVVCVVIVVAWGLGPFYGFLWSAGSGRVLYVDHGAISALVWATDTTGHHLAGTQILLPHAGVQFFRAADTRLWWTPRLDRFTSSGTGPSGPADTTELVLPLWIPLAVLATPTALLWRTEVRRRRRSRAGACAACGYDRGGLTPTATCPECGSAPRAGGSK